MAGHLVALPPVVLSDNVETKAQLSKTAQKYLLEKLQTLGVKEQQFEETRGSFLGTRVFAWDNNFSAHLQVTFVTQIGSDTKREFLRIVSLVRREDCIHLGSTWETIEPLPKQAPQSLKSKIVALKEVTSRKFGPSSTLRLDSEFLGAAGSSFAAVFDASVSERLAAEGVAVNTWNTQLACKWQPLGIKLVESKFDYPARPHRILRTKLILNGENWPQFVGNSTFHNGVFGEAAKVAFKIEKPQMFEPNILADNLLPIAKQMTHNLTQENFRVLKREGRWVYLDRGRAYGLEIGAHLVGPSGSELHVIQYAKSADENPDLAVAFVRKESAESPVKAGDSIQFDLRSFPPTK